VLIVGTSNQLRAVSSAVPSVADAGIDLSIADEMKVLRVKLDRWLTFDKHITMVARACNYHAHPSHTASAHNQDRADVRLQSHPVQD